MSKRMGRPTKRPKPGTRVPLSMRVTPAVRKKLERAALRRGRSISQEAEIRLEQSFDREGHLILSRNDIWSSVFTPSLRTIFPDDSEYAELWVILGDKPHDARVPERPDADHL